MQNEEVFERPETGGELLEALKQGKKCEVMDDLQPHVLAMLMPWLKGIEHKVYASPNEGWLIYEAV